MNTTDNQRSRETKQSIQRALIQLLKDNKVPEITIKEISALCQINRATFYRHYQDVYDLFEQIQRNMMEQARQSYFSPPAEGHLPFSRLCFQNLFEFVSVNTDYYAALLNQQQNARIVDLTQDYPHNSYMPPLIQTLKLESTAEEQFRMAYFDGGLNAVIRRWIKNGYPISPQKLAYFMEKEYQYEVAQIETATEVFSNNQLGGQPLDSQAPN